VATTNQLKDSFKEVIVVLAWLQISFAAKAQ
jgi:hypothetical protein